MMPGPGTFHTTTTTFTLIQHPTTFSCTTVACAVTTSSTTAGNLLVLWSAARYTGTGNAKIEALTSVTDNGTAETWVHCPNSAINDANSSDATLFALDCWYVLSAAGGATTVTATWEMTGLTGSSQKVDATVIEYHPSATPIFFDAGNTKYTSTSCSSCTGPPGLLSGTSDLVSQAAIFPDFSGFTVTTAVSAPYSNPTDLENTNHIYGAFAGALNQSSYSVPTWTAGGSHQPSYYSSVAFSSNATPAPTANMLLDSSGGSNGGTPTTTTLKASIFSGWAIATGGAVDISSMGTGMKYATSVISSNLPATTTINGVAKTGGSTLDLKGTTNVGGNGIGYIEVAFGEFELGSYQPLTLGYTFRSTCPANTECGASVRLLDANSGYAMAHVSAAGNGLFCLESSNGSACQNSGASYAINTNYRVNVQKNPRATATAGTVTFSNGSAVITFANTFAAGQGVQFKTTGGLPTNFAINTTYYVIATGLSSSQFEVSATPGGTAITAGSAGSGTQSVLILGMNKMTICNDSTGAVLGTATAVADASNAGIVAVDIGVTGEEPTTSGQIYYYRNLVIGGIYSTGSCF